MVNKNNLPKVSLTILSVIAVIVSFVFLWNLGESRRTLFEHVKDTLGFAIPSSLVLIALIWIGAKVDNSMAGIPQRNKRILSTLLAYLIIPATCAVFAGILSLLFATGFGDAWGKDASFGVFFIGMLAAIPFVFGTVFIYLGAIVSAASRWAAGLIWHESEVGR